MLGLFLYIILFCKKKEKEMYDWMKESTNQWMREKFFIK
jgi:hypothetical protein